MSASIQPQAGYRRQVTEAFPWDTAPRYLLRDRDASYGSYFCNRVEAMNMVIFNERHLRRVLSSYLDYYQGTRTHLSLDKDCPDPRPIMPRRIGKVVAIAKVGGLHHRYERLAA
jgi:hypothetical protein